MAYFSQSHRYTRPSYEPDSTCCPSAVAAHERKIQRIAREGCRTPQEGSRSDFDAQPFRSYNVLPDALMVNFQTSRFTVIVNPQRQQPLIEVDPSA